MRILIVAPAKPELSFTSILNERSHTLDRATDCNMAEELIKQNFYDAAIIYLFFENLSSLELIGKLKKSRPTTLIFTTGNPQSDSPTERLTILFNVRTHLPHPPDPNTLIAALEYPNPPNSTNNVHKFKQKLAEPHTF